jgi:AcrR family transcriptional regulator
MIAEAAHDLGLERLTLKDVADHLEVSVAALYHHVAGKDDLLRLAAEYSATKVPLPEDHGQHWALWLLEWATYIRDAFLAQPGLLAQYQEGAISAEAIAGNIDSTLGLLVRQGFSITEAHAAYELVTSCALGTAVSGIREREAVDAGRTLAAQYEELLAESEARELPYLHSLLNEIPAKGRAPFAAQVGTVLIGIAIRRGEDWRPVAEMIDQLARPAPTGRPRKVR